jgi:hypothetical protein
LEWETGRGFAMAFPATDYSALRRQCLLWAEASDTQDSFEAFLVLAETWKRINELDESVRKRVALTASSALPANAGASL